MDNKDLKIIRLQDRVELLERRIIMTDVTLAELKQLSAKNEKQLASIYTTCNLIIKVVTLVPVLYLIIHNRTEIVSWFL